MSDKKMTEEEKRNARIASKKKYRLANLDKTRKGARERKRIVRATLSESELKKLRATAKAWQDKHPEKMLAYSWKRNGIDLTPEGYQRLLKEQNFCCKICGIHFEELKCHPFRLVVDHCHITLKVRGLLCASCNIGLGKFKDSIARLELAINYLKNQ